MARMFFEIISVQKAIQSVQFNIPYHLGHESQLHSTTDTTVESFRILESRQRIRDASHSVFPMRALF